MTWLIAPILVPFITAMLCLMAGGHPRLARRIGVGGAAVLCLCAFVLLGQVAAGGVMAMQAGSWPAPFGITLVADMLAALMVAVTGVVAICVAIYSSEDIDDRMQRSHYFALFHFLLMGVNGAFTTGDIFNLYVWFEVMLITSFVMLTMEGKANQLEGGVKYLIINLFSSMLFLSGIGLLYGTLGTLNMADLGVRLSENPNSFLANSSAMLLFVAFAVKAGLFPFFFWLPASYHTPRIAIAGLFAGLLTKVGVYALMRSYTTIFGSQFETVQMILIVIAAATMITGVLGAAAQFEIKRILSFHIISQIGYMIMGLAIGTATALAAATFYIIHHIIVKTNLYLIGGIIRRRAGSTNLHRIGGLYKWAPGLCFLFFIPAFSLGGIPPLSGFWAKLGVVQAGLAGHHYWLVTAALLVGVLTLYSMTKIWGEAFWKQHPTAETEHDLPEGTSRLVPFSILMPCVVMAGLTLVLGLWSAPLFELCITAGEQLMDSAAYLDAVNLTRGDD